MTACFLEDSGEQTERGSESSESNVAASCSLILKDLIKDHAIIFCKVLKD